MYPYNERLESEFRADARKRREALGLTVEEWDAWHSSPNRDEPDFDLAAFIASLRRS